MGKGKARQAFAAAIRKADSELIAQGLAAAVLHWDQAGTEAEFIPHPATWLNGERWLDVEPPRSATPSE